MPERHYRVPGVTGVCQQLPPAMLGESCGVVVGARPCRIGLVCKAKDQTGVTHICMP